MFKYTCIVVFDQWRNKIHKLYTEELPLPNKCLKKIKIESLLVSLFVGSILAVDQDRALSLTLLHQLCQISIFIKSVAKCEIEKLLFSLLIILKHIFKI